jgi:protein-disulfide isomerase
MSRNLKLSLAMLAAFGAAIVVVALLAGADGGDDSSGVPAATAPVTTTEEARPAARVVASDPRRLGPPGRGGVTFTEFLDFECESCRAVFPVIEELRREYTGRVTFNVRYFPLPGHANAMNAAIAVEAAAQQGKLEAMYVRMYETQASWGEQRESHAATFRGFAEDLGLDMAAFDAAVADPETAARVERDLAAGIALGVQGTPTFFIDETLITPETVDDLRRQLDEALAAAA